MTENPESRIAYILRRKPEHEQALRLRLFRPALDAAVATAQKAYNAAVAPAHAIECHGCPWDGKTIFAD